MEHDWGPQASELGQYLSEYMRIEHHLKLAMLTYIREGEWGDRGREIVLMTVVEDAGMPTLIGAVRNIIEAEGWDEPFADLPGRLRRANADRNWLAHSLPWDLWPDLPAGTKRYAALRRGKYAQRTASHEELMNHLRAASDQVIDLLMAIDGRKPV